MQIYELTQKCYTAPPVPVVESIGQWASNLVAPITVRNKQAAAANKQAGLTSVTPDKVAQKAQAIWTKYVQDWEADLTDPQEKADFLSRKDGMYKKQLLAFVQKNLLPGIDINRIINRDTILKIVDALSAPATPAGTAPAGTAPAGTPAALAQTRAAKQKAIQMRSGSAPASAAPADTATTLAARRAAKQKAAGAKAQAQLTTPRNTPVTEALAPAAETALWRKLAGEIQRAQVEVKIGQPAAAAAAQSPGNTNTSGPAPVASALAQRYSRSTAAAAALGKAAMAAAGTSVQAKSTDNAAADAILQLAGFQVS